MASFNDLTGTCDALCQSSECCPKCFHSKMKAFKSVPWRGINESGVYSVGKKDSTLSHLYKGDLNLFSFFSVSPVLLSIHRHIKTCYNLNLIN